eukprot:2853312-Amphidinium_carterae.1
MSDLGPAASLESQHNVSLLLQLRLTLFRGVIGTCQSWPNVADVMQTVGAGFFPPQQSSFPCMYGMQFL